MRKWKNALALCLAAPFLLTFSTAAFADVSFSGAEAGYEGVYDLADLFTDSEERSLSGEIAALRDQMEMDLAVVTTDNAYGYSAQNFADKFYIDKNVGMGDALSGALFLIDMDNREMAITTDGDMVRYLPDSRVEAIFDDTYEHASDGDYYGAAGAFVADVKICYENKIAANQYNQDTETGKISRYRSIRWYEAVFAAVVAAVCGFAAVGSVTHDYGMKGKASRMTSNFQLSYRKDSAFRMGNILADVLLGSFITHRIISSQKNNNGGFGGGGGGHSLSGGGRSSTHSFGGRSFGGGSRKF